MDMNQTGIMVSQIHPGTDKDALKVGDVILAVDGKKVANNGNIRLADGQPRYFSTVISAKQIGETVKVELLRDGKALTLDMPVQKQNEKVEPYLYDRRPEYFIIGGLVFTRLTSSYLLTFGSNTPPIEMIEKLRGVKDSPDENVVVLTQVLGDEVNVGYQNFDSMVLVAINGKKVRNLREVVEIVESCKDEYITFTFAEDWPVVLDLKHLRAANRRIMSCLSRLPQRCLPQS